jgi:hypothetical protein
VNYLDAAIGFAVVMAVFSGAITAFVETIWRMLRVREGNMIAIVKQLDAELEKLGDVNLTPTERWTLLRSILNNPLKVAAKAKGQVLPGVDRLLKDQKIPVRLVSVLSSSGKLATDDDSSVDAVCKEAVEKIGRQHALAGVFETVSAEHVARRFADIYFAKERSANDLRRHLQFVIREFESLYSSMSAEFKRRSELVSIALGIVLALVFNINGLRILDTFVASPEVSKVFATELDRQESEVLDGIERARGRLDSLGTSRPAATEGATDDHGTTTSAGDFKAAVNELESVVTSLSDRGVPVGFSYWPHCEMFESIVCVESDTNRSRSVVVELFLVMLTGVLIGLGAPFWFDVAKRLAAVRGAFGGTRTSSESKAGRDAGGSPKKRKVIVDDIVADMGGQRTMNVFENFFNVTNNSSLECKVRAKNRNVHCRAELVDQQSRLATWTSADIMDADGIESPPLVSTGVFYVLTLDMTFQDDDTATVLIQLKDGSGAIQGNPWAFELAGKKQRTHSAITTVLMI